MLQCSNANCDWSVTSAKALSHREVTLVLSPFPCMHVSLLYQTNSLEYQLQLKETANHRHRLGILIYLNPLCAKYNIIMHLVSNNEIKMAAHRRNLAYNVFVLYDHFLRTNDVERSL